MKASQSPLKEMKTIPTGLAPLDELLNGGVFLRRIAQFSGRFSCGKSTLAALVVAQAQRMGYDTCWIDAENRFSFKYSETLGVDLSKLELLNGQTAEEYFNFIEAWCAKHKGVIVLDSVAALMTRNEMESENKPTVPEVPKMIPNFLKRVSNILVNGEAALIILNHEKVDFDGALKVVGGRSVEHFVTQWIRLRKMTMKPIKKGANQIGDTIEASMKKDGNQYKNVQLELIVGEGFRGFKKPETIIIEKPKKRGRPKTLTTK